MKSKSEDLIELVFERLDETTAKEISKQILGRPMKVPTEEMGVWEEEIAIFKLTQNLYINRVHIRILRYEGMLFDVELNFTLSSVSTNQQSKLTETLQDFATCHASRNNVKSYYAGLEPAIDRDTRIFTGTEIGPYRLT